VSKVWTSTQAQLHENVKKVINENESSKRNGNTPSPNTDTEACGIYFASEHKWFPSVIRKVEHCPSSSRSPRRTIFLVYRLLSRGLRYCHPNQSGTDPLAAHLINMCFEYLYIPKTSELKLWISTWVYCLLQSSRNRDYVEKIGVVVLVLLHLLFIFRHDERYDTDTQVVVASDKLFLLAFV